MSIVFEETQVVVGWVDDKDLGLWVEYKSLGMFRTRVLGPLHRDRLIEYDSKAKRGRISPKGSKDVEERILESRKP